MNQSRLLFLLAYFFYSLTFFTRLLFLLAYFFLPCKIFDCRERNSCTVRVPAAITTLTTTITENMQYACSSLTPTADALSHSESHEGSCTASSIVQEKRWWYIRYCCHTHFTHFAFFAFFARVPRLTLCVGMYLSQSLRSGPLKG